MSKTLIACVEDLFFRSKIEATARHLNVPVRFVAARDLAKAAAAGGTGAVLLELSNNGEALSAVRALRRAKATEALPVIGFLSHVDRKLAEEAQEAGVTQVMPRSQFSETLPDLLMDLLAPGTKREVQEEPELPDE
jgi:DNA-binding MurR/RpiR family transcriptional regulator